MRVPFTAIFVVAFALALVRPGATETVFVDASVTASGTKANWADARKSVAEGIEAASSGDQVWVKAGVYPESIALTSGVALYGGFAPADLRSAPPGRWG